MPNLPPATARVQEGEQRRRWDETSQATYDRWRAQRRTLFFDELYLDALRGPRVLEVGCGQGDMLSKVKDRVPGAQLAGLDISPVMVARCHARSLANVCLGSGNALPYSDAQFDSVLAATWVIRYLHVETALSEMARVTRPGGRIMFDLPFMTGHWLVTLTRFFRQDPRRWAHYLVDAYLHLDGRWVPSWRRRIQAAGLRVVDVVGGVDSPVRSARFSFRKPHRGPVGLAVSSIVWFRAEKPA